MLLFLSLDQSIGDQCYLSEKFPGGLRFLAFPQHGALVLQPPDMDGCAKRLNFDNSSQCSIAQLRNVAYLLFLEYQHVSKTPYPPSSSCIATATGLLRS